MALNENLQGVVNDLKIAKNNIAAAITSKGQPLPKDAGFNDFAGEINNLKPSSYQDVSGVTATASDILSGKSIVDANGKTITGNIATKTSSNLTASGATVTVPAGYYASNATKSVATTTQPNPTIGVSGSYITASYAPSVGYNSSTTGKASSKLASSLDTNLKAENIKSGISIFGVSGTLSSGYQVIAGASTPMSSALIIPLGEITKIHGIAFEISSVSAMSIGTQKIILSGIYVENAGYAVSSAFSSTGTAGQVGSIALNPPYISNNSAYISSANTNFSSAFKTSTDYYYVLWGE